jgi:hypothetical protein
MGTGHPFVDILAKCYRTIHSPGMDFLTQLGKINTRTHTYYFESRYKPKETDYIIELDFHAATGKLKQPFRATRLYKIQDVKAYIGQKSRIKYFRCTAEERNFDFGRSVVAPEKKRVDAQPTTLAPVPSPEVSDWKWVIADIENADSYIELSDTNTFTVVTLDGQEEVFQLTPNAAPPTGKIILVDINGVEHQLDLSEL